MNVVGHQAVAEQAQTVELGVVPEELQVDSAFGIVFKDEGTGVTWWAVSGATTRAKRAMKRIVKIRGATSQEDVPSVSMFPHVSPRPRCLIGDSCVFKRSS
jgi:hypothetical protein